MNKIMKAKEAPEKLYIPTILAANTVRYKKEGSIEYIRTDVLIERTCKYISYHQCEYIDFDDFKKIMEGE